MAVMAIYNPFFEKAGMKRIAERKPDKRIINAIRTLEDLGFKRYLLTSVEYNLEKLKSLTEKEMYRIRNAIVSAGQYKRLMNTSKVYPRKEEFENWIKQQDLRRLAAVLTRIAILAETKVYLFWKK